MMLRDLAPLLGLALLSGCATQADLRASEPGLAYRSARAPDTVRDCLVEAMSNLRQFGLALAPATVAPLHGGYTVNSPALGFHVFVDVEPRPGGSLITYHKGIGLEAPSRLGEVVKGCA